MVVPPSVRIDFAGSSPSIRPANRSDSSTFAARVRLEAATVTPRASSAGSRAKNSLASSVAAFSQTVWCDTRMGSREVVTHSEIMPSTAAAAGTRNLTRRSHTFTAVRIQISV